MDADRWKKIEELYQAAIALPPGKRAEFLAQACPAGAGLRGEVLSLLAPGSRSRRWSNAAPLAMHRVLEIAAQIAGGLARGARGRHRASRSEAPTSW